MKYLILDSAYDSKLPFYKGTYRTSPNYHDELPETHEVNQHFLWFCEQTEGDDYFVVRDLEKAKSLVKAYSNLPQPERFDIIEITEGQVFTASQKSEFLGYDLSAGCVYSLLAAGLLYESKSSYSAENLPQNDLLKIIEPLIRVVEEYFRPKLNQYRLFSDFATASFCLESMLALQAIHPGLWENETVIFEIVGLHKINL